MRSEADILATIEAGFQKQLELQKYIAKQLVKVIELQENQLDKFEEAAEQLGNV